MSPKRLDDRAPRGKTTPEATPPQRGASEKGAPDEGESLHSRRPQMFFSQMYKDFLKDATPEDLHALDKVAQENGHATIDEALEATLESPQVEREDRAFDEDLYKAARPPLPNRTSFWFDEDDEECITEEHDEVDEDDMTSMAHAKMDEIREMRHYARLIVWEMPLLHKFAQKFVPPDEQEVLRWRYTSYMGESHPAEKKVVVEFAVHSLGLTEVEGDKLRKLAGPRYNPETDIVKISSENFAHQAQNKRYLADLVDTLVEAAKDPTDTFEDVPLDLRHHEPRIKPRFPVKWRMTDERRQEIEKHRLAMQEEDSNKAAEGLMVDGQEKIDAYMLQGVEAMRRSMEMQRGKGEALKRKYRV